MSENIEILDCTLRDGGYYNNWDFDKEFVDSYCDFVEKSPIKYVEVGYRSIPLKGYLGEYFYCPIYVLKYLKSKMPTKELVIILNEKDIRPEHVHDLLEPCIDLVSMVRIAIDPKNMKRAINLAKKVNDLGFKLSFNVMYMSNWKQAPDFLDNLKLIEGFVDYFYMVDSFGGIMTDDVSSTIDMVREKSSKLSLGFHGHDNLHMALANTLEAIKKGCTIVDGTITGMGRGAGNLRTELFLTYLESKGECELDYSLLSEVVSKFETLKENYKWGTSLPYMFSGAYSLPQKQVMEWVGLNRYPISSILNALKNQKELIEDNIKLNILEKGSFHERVLIIGGGDSVKKHEVAIKKMLERDGQLCLIHAGARNVRNFIKVKNKQFYALVGSENEKLANSIEDYSLLKGKCVYPPYPRKMGTQIPEEIINISSELENINFTEVSEDSPLAISIQIALDVGAKSIYFIGFDGYKNEINGIQLLMTQENQKILDDASLMKKIKIQFLAPTRYKNMELDSIYNYV